MVPEAASGEGGHWTRGEAAQGGSLGVVTRASKTLTPETGDAVLQAIGEGLSDCMTAPQTPDGWRAHGLPAC